MPDLVKLSACMLTLNEVSHVQVTVPALLRFVDQLVILDGGSTDGTLKYLENLDTRIHLEVVPQAGVPYTADWGQEWRRSRLEELADGNWIIQVDADEYTGPQWHDIKEVLLKASITTMCFGVHRIDYAADLYHAFMPYTNQPHLPRIWRKGAVDWNTGRAIHMIPYLMGTTTPITFCGAPTFVTIPVILHHLHRCEWLGKARHKIRTDEDRATAISRTGVISLHNMHVSPLPRNLIPDELVRLAQKQLDWITKRINQSVAWPTTKPKLHALYKEASNYLNRERVSGVWTDVLDNLIKQIPAPLLFYQLGEGPAGLCEFLCHIAGGVNIVSSNWLEASACEVFVDGICERSDLIVLSDPLRPLVTIPGAEVSLLYIDCSLPVESLGKCILAVAPMLSPRAIVCCSNLNKCEGGLSKLHLENVVSSARENISVPGLDIFLL